MQHENCAFWAKTVIIDSWEHSHSRKLHRKKHDNLFWIWSDCSRKTAARGKIVDVSQESVRFYSIHTHRKKVVWCRQPKAHNISSVSQKKATQQVGWKRAWAAWGLGVSKSGSCMYRMRTRPRRELNLPPTNQIRVSKRRAPFLSLVYVRRAAGDAWSPFQVSGVPKVKNSLSLPLSGINNYY